LDLSRDKLQAQFDFDTSRRQAFWNEMRAVLTRRARTLLSFDDVMRVARMEAHVDRGVGEIPLAQIKGSEGRVNDFDSSFLPLRSRLKERWARLDVLMHSGVELPPIEVYGLGDVYFVKDGHHRVSVARHLEWKTIRAHVVEVRTRAPLSSHIDAEELLRAAEYAAFLDRTQLDRLRPAARLECSDLGRCDVMFDHILGHRYFLGLERGREVPLPQAAASWFDLVYRPIMEVVERHQIAERLPSWTDADLYLALTRRWLELSRDGDPTGPESAGAVLLEDAAEAEAMSALSRAVRRWVRPRGRPTIWLGSTRQPRKPKGAR
jgi:hypothetical protein